MISKISRHLQQIFKPIIVLLAIYPVLSIAPVAAQVNQKVIPDTYDLSRLSFSPLVKQTASSVVGINALKIVSRPQPTLATDQFFRHFFDQDLFVSPEAREEFDHSLGSGVIVHEDGYVVTSYHVIEGANQIQVIFNDQRRYFADVQMSDISTDIAVLKIRDAARNRFTAIRIGDSDLLEVGDLVIAIGNPFRLGQTVTTGIVSALSRPLPQFSAYSSFIQTDAGINPGNSGGALINTRGELIGINTAIFSSTGGYQGIGFAIPSRIIARAIDAAIKRQPFLKPWTGVIGESISTEHIRKYGLDSPTGVLVRGVIKDSPAFFAKLKASDVILSLDGQTIHDLGHLTHRVATYRAEQVLPMTLLRNGQVIHANFTTDLPPLKPVPQYWHGEKYFRGATFANISPAIAQQLSIPEYYQGVALVTLTPNSPAARVGLKRGDILVNINKSDIANTITLRNVTLKYPTGRIFIEYIRSDSPRRIIIETP